MSKEIAHESGLMMLLGPLSTDQRVAAFLLNLSTRMQARLLGERIQSMDDTRTHDGQPYVFEVPEGRARRNALQAYPDSRFRGIGAGMIRLMAKPRIDTV
jgi:hypothetical protein